MRLIHFLYLALPLVKTFARTDHTSESAHHSAQNTASNGQDDTSALRQNPILISFTEEYQQALVEFSLQLDGLTLNNPDLQREAHEELLEVVKATTRSIMTRVRAKSTSANMQARSPVVAPSPTSALASGTNAPPNAPNPNEEDEDDEDTHDDHSDSLVESENVNQAQFQEQSVLTGDADVARAEDPKDELFLEQITGNDHCSKLAPIIRMDVKKASPNCKQDVFYLPKGRPEKIRRLSSSCVHDLMDFSSNSISESNEKKKIHGIQSEEGQLAKCYESYSNNMLFALRHINGESWKPLWIQVWVTHRKESFPFIKISVFRRLSPEDCMTMEPKFLVYTTPEQLEAITPQCFAELSWTKELVEHNKSSLQRLFRKINPSKLTRLYKPLPGIIATFLDISQIQKIPPSHCQYLSLELMRPSVLRMVSVECLRSYLLERDITTPTLSWKSLSGTVTRKLLEKEDIVVRLRHDDWKVMPTDIFETVSAKFMDLCTLLEVEGIKVLFPVPPIHCISHLNQDHVLDVLKSHNSILPKEYFSLLTADMVSKFPDGFDTFINMDLKPFQWMALGQDINSGVIHVP